MNSDIIQGERMEMTVWSAAYRAAPPDVAHELGLSTSSLGQAAVFRAHRAPSWFLNRVLGVGVFEPVLLDALDVELERYRDAGVPHGVCLAPEARPAELASWLAERDLHHTTTLARMFRDLERIPADGGDVEVVAVDPSRARLFGETVAVGFGFGVSLAGWFENLCALDGWHAYLALIDGTAVGTGVLCVDGDLGWLGFGSTLGDYRRRGVHRSMLSRRMRDAAELGCQRLQTETNLGQGDEPTPSLDNIRRCGFQMAYERRNFVWDPLP